MKNRKTIWSIFAAGLIVLAVGCGEGTGGDGDGDGDVDAGDDDDAFTKIFNASKFQSCAGCHAPGAPGNVAGVEQTQDWSSRDAAFNSLKGNASGLIGNFTDCNGVPLIGATAADSLLVAVLDQDVRGEFANTDFPACDVDVISDMTINVGGALDAQLLADLKAWVDAGAPDM